MSAPEFLDIIYLIPPVSDHVAKFHGDRSRDGGEKLAKEIKRNITSKIEGLPFYRTGGLTRAVLSPGNRTKPRKFRYVKSVRNFM